MVSELTEADIPGASLEGQAPEALKIAELKFWLRCRGASGLSKLKTKSDYVQQFVVPEAACSHINTCVVCTIIAVLFMCCGLVQYKYLCSVYKLATSCLLN